MESTGAIQSISNRSSANCYIATETVLCSEKTTRQSLKNTCKQHQQRYKRCANEMDIGYHIERSRVESDDTIASQPLTIDPNFDPNFIPPVIYSFFGIKL